MPEPIAFWDSLIYASASELHLERVGAARFGFRRLSGGAMHGALSPWLARDTRPLASSTLPILSWDGRTPTSLIGPVEANLAAGMRFVVLATTSPLGRVADRRFLQGWWCAVQPRMAGMCDGWAVVAPDADARPDHCPAQLMRRPDDFAFVDFPVRFCAERAEALGWLQARHAGAGQNVDPRCFQ